MKLVFIFAVLLVNAGVTSAFSILRTPRTDSTVNMSLALSTLDSKTTNVPNIQVSQTIDDKEMQEVRQELIEKYLAFGKSLDVAESEVDKFLRDPDRSRQFLDMRRYNKAQKDAMLGFESPLMFLAAFSLGMIGNYFFHFLDLNQLW